MGDYGTAVTGPAKYGFHVGVGHNNMTLFPIY